MIIERVPRVFNTENLKDKINELVEKINQLEEKLNKHQYGLTKDISPYDLSSRKNIRRHV